MLYIPDFVCFTNALLLVVGRLLYHLTFELLRLVDSLADAQKADASHDRRIHVLNLNCCGRLTSRTKHDYRTLPSISKNTLGGDFLSISLVYSSLSLHLLWFDFFASS